jgi:tryptophan halogenase
MQYVNIQRMETVGAAERRRIQQVTVLGAGSAGLLAAITLKLKLPELQVIILHDPTIPIIGVGEGTTKRLPLYLHGYLGIDPTEFHAAVQPTYKLGIRLLWGPRARFHYTFTSQLCTSIGGLSKPPGFHCWDEFDYADAAAALMAFDKAFAKCERTGAIRVGQDLGYHLHNGLFVDYLNSYAVRVGVEIVRESLKSVASNDTGVTGLVLGSGRTLSSDLYVDCSGFRAELIGRVLNEPFQSFQTSLYCDRAVIGGWPRSEEVLLPFTTAETMNAGWCFRTEHEDAINCGYVFASAFLNDDEAEAEFRRKTPNAKDTRIVKFISGARRRTWVKNVVAIGNAAGFVEPLDATALTAICDHTGKLVHALLDANLTPNKPVRHIYNAYTSRQWSAIRRFLALHYKFNKRIDTPFWRACHADTELAGGEELVEYYESCGPSRLLGKHVLGPDDPFHWEGYLVLFVGLKVPSRVTHTPSEAESRMWQEQLAEWRTAAQNGVDLKEALQIIRSPQWRWDMEMYRNACRW